MEPAVSDANGNPRDGYYGFPNLFWKPDRRSSQTGSVLKTYAQPTHFQRKVAMAPAGKAVGESLTLPTDGEGRVGTARIQP